jgi:putative transposase
MELEEKLIRVERHIIVNSKTLEDLCYKSACLYNYVNYQIRQTFFETGKFIGEYDQTKKLSSEKQIDYKALPAQTSQQIVKVLYQNWNSFFRAVQSYAKNPKLFNARPRIPKYKKGIKGTKSNLVIFTNQQCRIKDGYLRFPKATNIQPIKTNQTQEILAHVRIVPQATCYVIEVAYIKEQNDLNLPEENILSIDLGLGNLATCINNVGSQPFVINGRAIKSINQYYNKTKARLQSIIGVGTSKRIKRITLKRNNKIEDYMHKTSRHKIEYCVENKIGTIVIGKNDGWKQNITLGSRTNQNFVNIPFIKLINQITYKAEDLGISVMLTEESYTSKIDHFALEEMKHQDTYLGKRVKRGLFQSSANVLLNADINGAIGIGRKVVGDVFVFTLQSLLNRGVAFTPIRINIT